jgi:hypothetical protein
MTIMTKNKKLDEPIAVCCFLINNFLDWKHDDPKYNIMGNNSQTHHWHCSDFFLPAWRRRHPQPQQPIAQQFESDQSSRSMDS